jgi:hypothetical protein
MINAFVAQHAIISEALAMRPAKLLVYLVIIVATVQRMMRENDLPEDIRAGSKIPVDKFGFISRRAIAAATGMPNENVRRLVSELLADGLLITGPAGGVRNIGGNFQNPRVLAGLHQMFAETVRLQQHFLDLGVTKVEP